MAVKLASAGEQNHAGVEPLDHRLGIAELMGKQPRVLSPVPHAHAALQRAAVGRPEFPLLDTGARCHAEPILTRAPGEAKTREERSPVLSSGERPSDQDPVAAGVLELVFPVAVEELVAPTVPGGTPLEDGLHLCEKLRGRPGQRVPIGDALLEAPLLLLSDLAKHLLERPRLLLAKEIARAADGDGHLGGPFARKR
jgi:hypothetical protein